MKMWHIVVGFVVLVVLIGMVVGIMGVSYSNQEIRLRNLITAKLKDNQSEYDNLWKKISQVKQVAQKDRESLMEIFNSYASARTPKNDNAPLMKWVQESIPNVNQATFTSLQNTITESRDNWTMRQKELIDYKREHDNLRTTFPSNIFVGKRSEIEITVITSDKTETVFKEHKDNDVKVF